MKTYFEIVQEEVAKYIPKKGFNVCVFDDFGRPGEMLELVGHKDTIEEAEKLKQKLKGETVYIYSPDGTKKTN